jgi:hypothetical protein
MGGKLEVPAPPKYPPVSALHAAPYHEEAIKHVLEMELPNKVTVWRVTQNEENWHVHAAINIIDKSVTIKLKGKQFPYEEALNKLRAFL